MNVVRQFHLPRSLCCLSHLPSPNFLVASAHRNPVRHLMTEAKELHPFDKAEQQAALVEPHEATKDFIFQQTMFRVKDPKASLEFYSGVLGMRLLKRFDFPTMTFSLFFMGYATADELPADEDSNERTLWTFRQKATLELTHNWGTESDPKFQRVSQWKQRPKRIWSHWNHSP
eukprot:TRINITY_DN23996_c0_g1_i1.p1 TRINITY_DN23996_c0_g1~~TRINITY_DN23996_c0_g1_i1.p1  ORF type:complete len:173 (-),score=36.03 TRINITY_DN23996_c0_g1_i1:170-688(-)